MQNVAKLNALPCLAILSLLSLSYLKPVLAGDWQVNPGLSVRATYSDNIMLGSRTQGERQDVVSEVVPTIEVLGKGNRLNVRGNYSLQSIYYARNATGSRNVSQFLLASDAEVVEDWFYVDFNAQQAQRQISTANGIASDNLTPTSARSDVLTTTISPRIKHSFGRGLDLDAGYSESQVRYDDSSLQDALIKKHTLRLSRGLGLKRLSWALSYDQDEQARGDALSSERKTGSGVLRYRVLDHLSVVANGGREVGSVVGGRSFRQGNYWSAGFLWGPTPRFSLELSSGKDDKQGAVTWAPTARTSLGVTYVDRNVGVRPSVAWTGFFNHRTRRTKWGLSYVDEISTDARLQVIGQTTIIERDEFDVIRSEVVNLYDITNEEFTRASSRADFSYLSKKNQIGVALNKERRDYETSARQGVTDGATLSWTHNFSRRINASLRYLFSSKRENLQSKLESNVFSLGMNWEIGHRILVGMEYRQARLSSDDVNRNYVENRLSANLKITL